MEKKGIQGRILTTDYNNFTDPKALEKLAEFTNIELRIYQVKTGENIGFHIIMKRLYYCLLACKEIRNAAAHSNCILNDLHLSSSVHNVSYDVMNALAKIPTLSATSRRKKMTNDRIREIITLMYTHKELVSSEGVHNKTSVKLHEFVSRMNKNKDYYKDNSLIFTSFDFIEKVIDFWFSEGEHRFTRKNGNVLQERCVIFIHGSIFLLLCRSA